MISRRMPPGITLEPFEFSILAAYFITSGKLLIDATTHANDVLIKALPFRGLELFAWLAILLIASGTGMAGLLLRGRRSIFLALQIERAGLVLVGGAVITYLAGIVDLIGWTATNLTLVTTAFQLLAIAYKVAQISRTIGLGRDGER